MLKTGGVEVLAIGREMVAIPAGYALLAGGAPGAEHPRDPALAAPDRAGGARVRQARDRLSPRARDHACPGDRRGGAGRLDPPGRSRSSSTTARSRAGVPAYADVEQVAPPPTVSGSKETAGSAHLYVLLLAAIARGGDRRALDARPMAPGPAAVPDRARRPADHRPRGRSIRASMRAFSPSVPGRGGAPARRVLGRGHRCAVIALCGPMLASGGAPQAGPAERRPRAAGRSAGGSFGRGRGPGSAVMSAPAGTEGFRLERLHPLRRGRRGGRAVRLGADDDVRVHAPRRRGARRPVRRRPARLRSDDPRGLAVVAMFAAIASGSKPAAMAVAACGVVALMIFLLIDIPTPTASGTLDDPRQNFFEAEAVPQEGFWLGLLGALGLALSGAALATLGSDQTGPWPGRRPQAEAEARAASPSATPRRRPSPRPRARPSQREGSGEAGRGSVARAVQTRPSFGLPRQRPPMRCRRWQWGKRRGDPDLRRRS